MEVTRVVASGDVGGDSVPIAVPTDSRNGLKQSETNVRRPVMMTDDAKFALGF